MLALTHAGDSQCVMAKQNNLFEGTIPETWQKQNNNRREAIHPRPANFPETNQSLRVLGSLLNPA